MPRLNLVAGNKTEHARIIRMICSGIRGQYLKDDVNKT